MAKKKKMINSNKNSSIKFNEWLAGLIDGDGCFQLSKKGYASLEITLSIRDKNCLYQIKDRFGGSIKEKQGNKYLRYRLHNKKGLLYLIDNVNGLIRNPNRLLQLARLGEKYDIKIKNPCPLSYHNGWLSGFMDSDGSIYLNIESVQIFITASQKNKLLLDPLVTLYGGTIYTLPKVQAFKWIVYRKKEILNLIEYFDMYPLLSKKQKRIQLIDKIYESFKNSGHKASIETAKGKNWNHVITKWEEYKS
jgi:hypothetical protein